MPYPHVIRLRQPWQVEAADDGAVRWRRHFNWPTGLDDRERLWLLVACPQTEASLSMSLNGRPLVTVRGERGTIEGDATSFLKDRNELVIQLPATSGEMTLGDSVTIEIRLAPLES
ncbi:MAG: hypothetical protein DWQ31_12910 [Planctomycetota bacterium]|nr:MAG: hypothetical protein DWQ31_12910 [Planctomycetota bacterium]REJ89404.1 MAG: hypothetical protein DWQ35_18150 [Planctomycetota bacterium]REK26202.1 MAG: hypothetical protein DWQ42_09745 [Planctomycetota bacterium]REK44534.1 MAG: hypothetical protein DWQ46_09770 [Planctomycetota bacterium]